VEVVPDAIADSRNIIFGSVRPCAWDRRPKPRSPRRPNSPTVLEENPPTAPRLRNFAERFSSKALSDDFSEKSSMRPSPKLFHDAKLLFSRSEFFREAPACVERAATSKSRFRRSKRGMHADAWRFFYSRPILAQPVSHDSLVPLAGLPLRLLRRDAAFGQPLIDIMRMKFFAELASNQFGHARRAPEIGGKSKLSRREAKPLQNLPLLLSGEPGRSSRMRLGLQSGHAAFPIRSLPALDASRMNVEEIRYFLLRIARVETGNGQSPPPLPLGWFSFRYHVILYACT
jgi:hypothetical protein